MFGDFNIKVFVKELDFALSRSSSLPLYSESEYLKLKLYRSLLVKHFTGVAVGERVSNYQTLIPLMDRGRLHFSILYAKSYSTNLLLRVDRGRLVRSELG